MMKAKMKGRYQLLARKGRRLNEKYRSVLEPIHYSILKETGRQNDLVAVRTALLEDIALKIEGKRYKPKKDENVEFVEKTAKKAIEQIDRHTQKTSCDIPDELDREIAQIGLSRELKEELAFQLLYVASKRSTDIKLRIVQLGIVGIAGVFTWQMLKHCQQVEDIIENAKAMTKEREEANNAAIKKRWQEEQEQFKKK